MSRSYKKIGGSKDRNPWMKNYANRRFRRYKGPVQNGGWYKMYTNPYDICDYKIFAYTEKEVQEWIKDFGYKRYELFNK
jgi:hypothetical protein